ncbi:methylmalonic aciduria and homocystinuria type D protein [Pelagophyceae sp. CCMP2097]|nr:methylmalonic aciduria and homocystinuria type D protein [Pelagophyceae sp. CCMP2097]
MTTELLAPTAVQLGDGAAIEVTVHLASKAVLREIRHTFPFLEKDHKVSVIATCQHAALDLVEWGERADFEKDKLLERFMVFAKPLCEQLALKGYFADYIDPCSGLPMVSKDCNKVYDEVASMHMVLGYSVQNAGCCKILLHPRWGAAVYPASIFTDAPIDIIKDLLPKRAAASDA